MKKKLLCLLIVLMLCVICTVSITMAAPDVTEPIPVPTTMPIPVPPTLGPTPIPTAVPVFAAPTVVATNTYSPYAPWVGWVGYEFKFYSDGSVVYNFGKPTMISSNIKIDPIFEASGTWTNLGNDKYLVKINPVLVGGAPIIREYTRVVTYEDPRYPGKIIGEHLESSYEREAFEKNPYPNGDSMLWLERAKIN